MSLFLDVLVTYIVRERDSSLVLSKCEPVQGEEEEDGDDDPLGEFDAAITKRWKGFTMSIRCVKLINISFQVFTFNELMRWYHACL